jgi:hypothetical protein
MKIKMIINYEVEGGWYCPHTPKKLCHACGATLELTPREGHFNSIYWARQRPDGLLLYVCPNGCALKKANKKMESFLEDNQYKLGDSFSWIWNIKKIFNGWILKNGSYIPCKYMEHAYALKNGEQKEAIKFCAIKNWDVLGDVSWNTKTGLTKEQLKSVKKLLVAHGHPITRGIRDQLELPTGYIIF